MFIEKSFTNKQTEILKFYLNKPFVIKMIGKILSATIYRHYFIGNASDVFTKRKFNDIFWHCIWLFEWFFWFEFLILIWIWLLWFYNFCYDIKTMIKSLIDYSNPYSFYYWLLEVYKIKFSGQKLTWSWDESKSLKVDSREWTILVKWVQV